jgi:hypothetical protein
MINQNVNGNKIAKHAKKHYKQINHRVPNTESILKVINVEKA